MRRLWVLLAGVLALVAGAESNAACNPDHFSTFGSSYTYLYVRGVETQSATEASVIGHFWSPGAFATTGEQQCDERYWLYRGFPVTPPTWYVDGTLNAMPCTSGCPGNEMILTVEDVASHGIGTGPDDAVFAAARIDKTPAADPQYDFSRLGRDITLIQIPRPHVFATTSGDVFFAQFFVPDPAAGFYGLPGVTASDTITAFWIYSAAPPTSRERSAWTFVKRVPYTGGLTQSTVTLTCPFSGAIFLAAAIEFDNGQVITNYVSSSEFVECDAFAAGAGAVRDGGPSGLFVKREASGDLSLSWGSSCSYMDTQYNVYQGTIGSWTSHVSKSCGLNVRTSTFAPPPFDAYYLVVPVEAPYEGSYGPGVGGAERPAAASACHPKLTNPCAP